MQLIAEAEVFFAATGAVVRHGGSKAYYEPSLDVIQTPEPEAFRDTESYAATKAHELTHWTSHASRLAREFGARRFGDEAYAMEELVAELGAAFLCVGLGITPEARDDHAAYIGHWLKVPEGDKRAIFTAAAHAQRAVDYLHGLQGSVRRPPNGITSSPVRCYFGSVPGSASWRGFRGSLLSGLSTHILHHSLG
jgi:antirestriction protein ArdC